MIIMKSRISLLPLFILSTASVSAQGLHQQIKVEREIIPVKREASRLNILPQLQLSPLPPTQLNYSDKVITANVPNTFTMLAPVAWGEKLYTSPYRGYLAFGVGAPTAVATVSAGYKALDSDRTRLSIFGQYDGDIYTSKYQSPGVADRTLYWRDHTATIESTLSHAVGSRSSIDAGADYTYAYHNIPLLDSSFGQNSSRAGIKAGFNSRNDSYSYRIGLNYRHFGFYHQSIHNQAVADILDHGFKPLRQNLFGADITGSTSLSESSSVALDVDASFLRTGVSATPDFALDDELIRAASTRGLIRFTPHYDYKSSTVHARLGAELDLSINDGRIFHIAPEASLAWTPTQYTGFEIKAIGGAELNSLASLFEVTPYLNPYLSYGLSHIPFNIDARISLGTIFGGSIEFFGSYAKADSWLMPALSPSLPGGALFEATDISAFRFGTALAYKYRNSLSARVTYETAPNSYSHSYYAWRDRSRHVVKAQLELRPISPLTFTAGWEFKAGRRIFETVAIPVGDPDAVNPLVTYIHTPHSLGCISNLSLGGAYALSPSFTIFARGENLLSRRFSHIGLRYSQGAFGLIGASLKF